MEPTQNPTPVTNPVPRKKVSGRTQLALWLMIGPTALLIVVFLLYAIFNIIFTVALPASGGGPEGQIIGLTIANVILYIFGLISVITWLPGLIVGIVLLATKPPVIPTNQ